MAIYWCYMLSYNLPISLLTLSMGVTVDLIINMEWTEAMLFSFPGYSLLSIMFKSSSLT